MPRRRSRTLRLLALVACAAFLPLAGATADEGERLHGHITIRDGEVSAVGMFHKDKHVLHGFGNGYLTITEAYSKKAFTLRPFPGHLKAVTAVVFSPDDKTFASGGLDGFVHVWDTYAALKYRDGLDAGKEGKDAPITPTPRRALKAHTGGVRGVAYSANGKRIASCGADGAVKVWDAASGKMLYAINAHKGAALAVAFSPDGKHLVSGGQDKTAKVWRAAAGSKPLFVLAPHDGPVNGVAYSTDGKQIATGSGVPGKSGQVKLWDASTGKELGSFEGHTDAVTVVAFHPTMKRLASGSKDNSVRVWDLETKKELYHDLHPDGLLDIGFSGDGKLLGTVSPREAKLWYADGK